MCDEAWQQGATPSHEDLSLILGMETSSIRRMIRACTAEGGSQPELSRPRPTKDVA